jgi:hypothetical protein
VILVAIDEPRGMTYGGWVAGPVFKEVGQWALSHLRVNPRLRIAKTEGPSNGIGEAGFSDTKGNRPKIEQKGLLPDFRGRYMREVLKWARSRGLSVVLDGTGLAVRQHPKPGAPLKGVKVLKVLFQPQF